MPKSLVPILLLALLGIGQALAQETAGAPVASEAPAGPSAIAVADIPTRAKDDERFAQTVIVRARLPDPGARLVPQLDAIDASIDARTDLLQLENLKTLPVMRLESLERHWRFDARRFAALKAQLQQATAPYAEDVAELSKRRADWEATRAGLAGSGAAAALTTQVDAVIAQLKAAEQAVSAPLARQIDVGRRANAVEARIEAGQKTVAAAIDYIDSRLLHADAPPIWRMRQQAGDQETVLESIDQNARIESQFAADYNAAGLGNQRVLNVLRLLLLPLLIWLSLHNRRSAPGTVEDETAARVLRRPLSSWLLLWMMGILVLEADAPLMLHQFAMLVALIPVLRLLPAHGFRLLGPWPYVATALYLLERLGFLALLAGTDLYRLYELGLTVLALALTAWLLWRSRRIARTGPATRIQRTVQLIAWAAVVLLAVSAIANVVGAFSLAEMLTGGVIDSGYFGLMLYAGVNVFTALLHLLIVRRSADRLRGVRERAVLMLRLFVRLLNVAAVIGWLAYTMNRFRIFRPVYSTVEAVLTHTFKIGEISLTLGDVLLFVASVLIAFWSAKAVRFVLEEEVLPKMSLPRGVGNSVASLSYYALLMLGFLVALAVAGFEISQLAFLFGALGVGIGFGLQNVVNNFVSGLILMFERPIQPGDVVDIAGISGNVREIGMRATTIKTFDGADVVVPNGTLLSENLTNWTLRDMFRRIEIGVGVAYGSDPEQVIALMMDVVQSDPSVSKVPEPTAYFIGLGASSLDFSVRAWTRDYNSWFAIRSRLLTRIYAALNEAGIEIPFPQQDLHLRSVSEPVGAMLVREPRRGDRDDDDGGASGDRPRD
ncbi:mechanosensitive ion channel domain-containing protein [Marilutibacter maris]|uniref:Small mechanosensitive ion channel protein MscS n=1 Tax=Marilutibacter maris TaxID=1605891 RepID=A0A2U9TBM5_9GAMM|nr:mechanosensitive ion channel domain-containing protein [Lysobacter maris]AWV08597.1 small mechanosensitive ion channel protein MscS [Lysobacter maris]